MNEQTRQRGIGYKICDSVPFLGKPATLIIDHTQDAIAEHGFVIGSVKGALVGMIIALVMISSIEAVTAVFEVVREEVRLRWTAAMITARREAADERAIEFTRLHKIHLGRGSDVATGGVTYYAVDRSGAAHIVRHDMTPWGVFDFLNNFQPNAVASSKLESLPPGASVTPFYFARPSGDVAVTEDFPGKGKCVLAAFDGNIILIPVASYRSSGLPMKGDVSHDEE